MLVNNFYLLFEGSLEVKLPTTWTDGKAEVAKVKEEKRREEKKQDAAHEPECSHVC